MKREDLFKKYSKHPKHTYEIKETLSAADEINIAFVYSGRDRGKSFEISSQCIADAWYDNKQLGYIRRHDATIYDVELYFNDKHDFIRDMTDGQYEGITRKNGRLVFYSEVEKDGIMKKVPGKECGFFFALSRQGSYKSEQFPEVYNLIYEEVLTDDGQFLRAEPEKVLNLYSTVLRNKPRNETHLWLISNLVSAVNPYSKAWGIMLSRNKPGDIRISKLYLGSYNEKGEEDHYIIAAHYLENLNDLDKKDLKKNRIRVKTGVASNKWDELHLYTTIDLSFMRQFKPQATAIFEHDDMMIQCTVLDVPDNIYDVYVQDEDETVEPIPFSKTTMPVLYFRRKTTPIKPGTRIYSNNAERFSPYVTKGFKVLCPLDHIIKSLYDRGWSIGADNLTMNDFRQIYRNLSLVAC